MESSRDNYLGVPLKLLGEIVGGAISEVVGEEIEAFIVRAEAANPDSDFSARVVEITLRAKRSNFGGSQARSSVGEAQTLTGVPEPQASSSAEELPAKGSLQTLTGRRLNEMWQVNARHALYHHEGRWFHRLRKFPGALFDFNGFVIFGSEEEFLRSPHINVTRDVHVPKGISSMPNYERRR